MKSICRCSFSLRVLLASHVFTGLLFAVVALSAHQSRKEIVIGNRLLKSGFIVKYDRRASSLWFPRIIDLCATNEDIDDNALHGCGRLTRLRAASLTNTQITNRGIEHLLSNSKLIGLDVRNTQISDGFFDILRGQDRLVSLKMQDTEVTGTVMDGTPPLPSLRYLYLTGSRFTDDGCESLARFTALTHLALEDTLITDRGVAYLADLKRLEQLYLDRVSITDRALECFNGTTAPRLFVEDTLVTECGANRYDTRFPNAGIVLYRY